MFTEDFIEAIADRLSPSHSSAWTEVLTQWQLDFLSNVARGCRIGRRLSTAQFQTAIKLIAQTETQIIENGIAGETALADFLAAPSCRTAPYETAHIPREVRYIGDNLLAFRYKSNDLLTRAVKALAEAPTEFPPSTTLLRSHAWFDWPHRVWVVPVYRHNIEDIYRIMRTFHFRADAATEHYLSRCVLSADQPSIIKFADDAGTLLTANVCDNYLLAAWITVCGGGVAL